MSERLPANTETAISPETFKRFVSFIKERAAQPLQPGELNKHAKLYGNAYTVDPLEVQLVSVTSIEYKYWDNTAIPREGGDDAQLTINAGINRASEVEVLALYRSDDNGINITLGGGMSEAADDDSFVNDVLDKIEALENDGKVDVDTDWP